MQGRPIRVTTGGDSRQIISDRCALVIDSTAKLGIVNSFSLYRRLIDGLRALTDTVVVPIAELKNAGPEDKKRISLRHDVDADIMVAIACARHLKNADLPGSFYLLHTSHYYGRFEKQGDALVFTRHDGLADLVAELRETGAEIGIHNDALGVMFDHDGDGIAHLKGEIAWLRSQGVDVRGSAAHNSAAVYGAENFEIFKGLAVGDRGVVHWRDRSIQLQSLDMANLGLEYEANHPRPRQYLDLKQLDKITGTATGGVAARVLC